MSVTNCTPHLLYNSDSLLCRNRIGAGTTCTLIAFDALSFTSPPVNMADIYTVPAAPSQDFRNQHRYGDATLAAIVTRQTNMHLSCWCCREVLRVQNFIYRFQQVFMELY